MSKKPSALRARRRRAFKRTTSQPLSLEHFTFMVKQSLRFAVYYDGDHSTGMQSMPMAVEQDLSFAEASERAAEYNRAVGGEDHYATTEYMIDAMVRSHPRILRAVA